MSTTAARLTRDTQVRLLQAAGRYVRRLFGQNAERIEQLERRVRAVELKAQSLERGFDYAGVYRDGEIYEARTFVTHGGSMWYCAEPTDSRPGESDDWVLAVKHGRDLRDRRR